MSVNRLHGFATICAIVISMLGCTQKVGKDFVRPGAANLILGTTMKRDILDLLGPPQGEANKFGALDDQAVKSVKSAFDPASVEGSFAQIKYGYLQATPPIAGAQTSIRLMSFLFYNDILISYDFVSSFANDSSNFDESRLAALEKGKTTEDETTRILGVPAGEAVYPAILTQGDVEYIYSYSARETVSDDILLSGNISYKIVNKRLSIIFGPDKKILDIRLVSNSSNSTDQNTASGGSYVPIIVPHHK